jgi:hypothetical protein
MTNHVHLELDDLGVATPMVCHDCGRPAFYCYDREDYFHADPSSPACFLIRERHERERVTVDGVELEGWLEHGAWYEVGRPGELGTLYAPMNADGSPPTSDELAEISEPYGEER